MLKIKSTLSAALLIASTFAAPSAFASKWTLSSGTSTILSGPTTATVLMVPVPCTASITLAVSATGVASVTAASFAGSSACTAIVASALPWAVTAPTAIASSTSVSATISGVNVKINGQTCTGSVTVNPLTNANPNSGGNNVVTFSGNLGACTVKSNPTITQKVTTPAQPTIGTVFP